MTARLLRRLRHDRRGVALIEFALVAPVLLLLFVGAFQMLDAISAYRKVTTTVRSLADLTTQSTKMSTGDADTILAAATQVMTPYSPNNALLRITEVKIDAKGVATVAWSRGRNTSAYLAGDPVTVPANMRVPSTCLVLAEIQYNYTPRVAAGIIGNQVFKDKVFMSPRNSAEIPMQ